MSKFLFELFQSELNTDFVVIRDKERTEILELSTVEALRGSSMSDCFSLVFTGQATDYLPQHTYLFIHPTVGEFELFIVPLGPEKVSGLMRYEAIFN